MQVFTIGHSNLKISDFIETLQKNDIEVVVDVRTFMGSKFTPHFDAGSLEQTLPNNGIEYTTKFHWALGDKDKNVEENQYMWAAKRVSNIAKRQNTVLMCSEGDYKTCHRYTKLAPTMKELGLDVYHIQRNGTLALDESHLHAEQLTLL